jgi:hypothetical protein
MSTPKKTDQQPGYETSDANVRSLFKYGIAFVALGLFAQVLMWFLFNVLNHEAKLKDPKLSPLATRQIQVPPQPRLQAKVVGDDRTNQPFDSLGIKEEFFTSEEQMLHSYGWIDKNSGVVRIPIDRAMELMVEKQNAPK